MIILKDLLRVCPMQTRFLIQVGITTKYVSPSNINKLEISTMLMKLKPYFYYQVIKIETTKDSDLIIVTLKELAMPTKAEIKTTSSKTVHLDDEVDDDEEDDDK